jgi:hypothetical protein
VGVCDCWHVGCKSGATLIAVTVGCAVLQRRSLSVAALSAGTAVGGGLMAFFSLAIVCGGRRQPCVCRMRYWCLCFDTGRLRAFDCVYLGKKGCCLVAPLGEISIPVHG